MDGDKRGVDPLPPSSDKKFWGKDAKIRKVDLRALRRAKPKKKHFPIHQQGPYFICKGCEFEHTIVRKGLSHLTHTVIDGKIVKRKQRLDKSAKK